MSASSALHDVVAIESAAPLRSLGRPEHTHVVQFYEADAALVANVVAFLAAGIRAGEPVIVIATPEHRAAFAAGLLELGYGQLTPDYGITMLDASDTLGKFMDGELPSRDKFHATVGALVKHEATRHGPGTLRAYGEMVDLLWRDGRRSAALALEGYWNELAQQHSFALLCAYVMDNFVKSGDADAFHAVCASHSHVIPAEGYSAITDEDQRMREISALQQRARSLEHEIAHRKQLELALREALAREHELRERAERDVRHAELFAAMLGHDLRNPLNTIAMGAQYLERAALSDKATNAAQRIGSSADRMARMIVQLLDFTRIRAAGGLALTRTHTELAEICARAKDELEVGTPGCAIALHVAGNTEGLWDPDRLLQVFSNLVGNAVTHGSASCEVSIEADGTDSASVVAYVRNAGAIAPDVLPVLFEPFRGDIKRPNSNGLGLGLYITRQIVLAHGGEIAVTSSDEQGTLVCVKLPRAPRASSRAR